MLLPPERLSDAASEIGLSFRLNTPFTLRRVRLGDEFLFPSVAYAGFHIVPLPRGLVPRAESCEEVGKGLRFRESLHQFECLGQVFPVAVRNTSSIAVSYTDFKWIARPSSRARSAASDRLL